MSYLHDVQGEEQETVEFTVRMGRQGFELLQREPLRVSEIWLTKQPDGSYALGVVTAQHPSELGYRAQRVETDDRREQFPDDGASGAIDMRLLS